jgi:hypothetical protein
MREIAVRERIYYAVIAAAALFVTWLGFFEPVQMDESFTWAELPPLHARFVGALYLFGGVYMISCCAARFLAQVRPALPAVVLFTSLLFVITALNPEAFDYDLTPPKVWTLSYVVYPLLGIGLFLAQRRRPAPVPPGPALPQWARTVLVAQAAVFGVAGVLLLLARELMVDVWPWPISNGLAQFYGGPFIAYAWTSWAYSRSHTWKEAMTAVPAMLAFVVATFVVSVVHDELFSFSDLADWLWFATFGALAAAFTAMCATAARFAPSSRGSTPETGSKTSVGVEEAMSLRG